MLFFAVAFGLLEGVSSDNENDSTDEESEHSVENFLLYLACSPLLRCSPHEEELCKMALTCHFSSDVIVLCQD